VLCPRVVPDTGRDKYGWLTSGGLALFPLLPRAGYSLTFNNGERDPAMIHWIVAVGTPAAITRFFLNYRRWEVKGRPTVLRRIRRGARRLLVIRFPDHPSGGQLGGHVAVFEVDGKRWIVASVHGYSTYRLRQDLALVDDLWALRDTASAR